ncbi:MAG TPA: ribosome assembly RNA-binding protein YhbY [Thermoanaerobaculia bacterium]|jgi:RNA-binding protein
MNELTAKQRKRLRAMAHALEPVVHVGKLGASDEVVRQVDRALAAHELVKVRFVAGREEKAAFVAELSARTGAAAAGVVGHVAILYRPHAEAEKRRIRLADR